MEEKEFLNLDYLRLGNERQQQAFNVIMRLGLSVDLIKYSPILAGTIPLSIDVDSSDLDILCEVTENGEFNRLLQKHYGDKNNFKLIEAVKGGRLSVICSFSYESFQFEIFGQDVPVNKQDAFTHMIVEYRLLKIGGKHAREEIVKLKSQGMKTEPAFSKYFNITGNPYKALRELAEWSYEDLSSKYLKKTF